MKFDCDQQRDALTPVEVYPLVSIISELVAPFGHEAGGAQPYVPAQIIQRAMSAAVHAEREITALRERIAELECLVSTDMLTGVLNRRGFEAELQRTLDLAQRHGETGVLLFVDLDDFKRVNDTYGHDAGDEVLRQIAWLLKRSVRRSDVVARVGGDEFVVLLTKSCAIGGMRRKKALEQILRTAVVPWHDHMIKVGASVGARSYGPDDTCDALIREADARMYAEKFRRSVGGGRLRRVQSCRPLVTMPVCTEGTAVS